jgi:hypothetical protein
MFQNWQIYSICKLSFSWIKKNKQTKQQFVIYEENVGQHMHCTLITDCKWFIFLNSPLILGVIKHENLRISYWIIKKAWHRICNDVFTNVFATEVASLFHLKIFAILYDPCISEDRKNNSGYRLEFLECKTFTGNSRSHDKIKTGGGKLSLNLVQEFKTKKQFCFIKCW